MNHVHPFLNKAESLMKDNDPVFQYTMDQLNNIGAEGYEDVSVDDGTGRFVGNPTLVRNTS